MASQGWWKLRSDCGPRTRALTLKPYGRDLDSSIGGYYDGGAGQEAANTVCCPCSLLTLLLPGLSDFGERLWYRATLSVSAAATGTTSVSVLNGQT
jgi:hypothetical protein